jgi:hypothetical protein
MSLKFEKQRFSVIGSILASDFACSKSVRATERRRANPYKPVIIIDLVMGLNFDQYFMLLEIPETIKSHQEHCNAIYACNRGRTEYGLVQRCYVSINDVLLIHLINKTYK